MFGTLLVLLLLVVLLVCEAALLFMSESSSLLSSELDASVCSRENKFRVPIAGCCFEVGGGVDSCLCRICTGIAGEALPEMNSLEVFAVILGPALTSNGAFFRITLEGEGGITRGTSLALWWLCGVSWPSLGAEPCGGPSWTGRLSGVLMVTGSRFAIVIFGEGMPGACCGALELA